MATTAINVTAQEFMDTITSKARELGVQPCDLMSEMMKITPKRRGRPRKESPAESPKTTRKYETSRPDTDATDLDLGTTSIDIKGRTWIVVSQKAFKGTKKTWKLVKQDAPKNQSSDGSLDVPSEPAHHVPTGDELRKMASQQRKAIVAEEAEANQAEAPTKRTYNKVQPLHSADSVDIGVTALDSNGRTWVSSEVKAFKGTKRIWKLVKEPSIEVTKAETKAETKAVAKAEKPKGLKIRSGPQRSAKDAELGEIEHGNDGNKYIVAERFRTNKATGELTPFQVWQRMK